MPALCFYISKKRIGFLIKNRAGLKTLAYCVALVFY
jgi:hypothetical protein|eukprot:COSAG01_NODE_5272_length_4367_cov_52.125117_6_plen_36_part_00